MLHLFCDLIRFVVTVPLGNHYFEGNHIGPRELADWIIQELEGLEEIPLSQTIPPIGAGRNTSVEFLASAS